MAKKKKYITKINNGLVKAGTKGTFNSEGEFPDTVFLDFPSLKIKKMLYHVMEVEEIVKMTQQEFNKRTIEMGREVANDIRASSGDDFDEGILQAVAHDLGMNIVKNPSQEDVELIEYVKRVKLRGRPAAYQELIGEILADAVFRGMQ